MQLDNHLKQLLRELGHAINDTVSDSTRITAAISEVRAAGFDIVLKLDATIGLARRDADDIKVTPNDRRFLESLHLRGLRLNGANADVLFHRINDEVAATVTQREGTLRIVITH